MTGDHLTTAAEAQTEADAARGRAGRLMRAATYASVGVASTLIVAKFAAWLLTDSVAMLSTLIDSLLDAAASLVNLFAVRHALQPADAEHRFGHGKAEPLAGLAQAAFITGSAAFLLIEAGERLIRPQPVSNSDVGLAVMGLAIVLTLVLVGFQRYVVRETGSVAINADSLHYKTDLLVNSSVIVSLLLATMLGWTLADPLFAIAIAAYIVWGAWQIGREALNILMDRELPDADRERIREIALAHPEVVNLHDMRTRSSGPQVFIQLHLEMNGRMSLHQAHEVAETVMYELEAAFPQAEVLIHEDPVGIDERKEFED